MGQDRNRRLALADRNPNVTAEKMRQVQSGMTAARVTDLLGEPADRSRVLRRRGVERQTWRYSDGNSELSIYFNDDEVRGTSFREGCSFGQDTIIFAGVFQFFFLRLMVFFGCVFVFINLFRGELLDKSLHYYLLSPIRREILVAGKFLAGLLATVVIFCSSVALQFTILNLHFEPQVLEQYMAQGNGWSHLFSYLGVTALACLGYGTVFLTAGIFLRNPLIPAVTIEVWESINGILPAVLRKFSVIYYLRSLAPVEIPIDRNVPPPIAMLALNVEPVAPYVAVLGVMAVSAALLVIAARSARSLQINYSSE
jgi:ABC-type Na+ efflux pump permease subunit